MTDNELLSLFQSGNEEAITAIKDKYHHYLYKISYQILGDNEDVEECLNDIWLAAWKAIPKDVPEKLLPYLRKYTEHQTISPDGTVGLYINTHSDQVESSDLKESRIVENGREFLVIEQDSIQSFPGSYEPLPEGWTVDTREFFARNIFWQEDKVLYNLYVCYPTDMKEEADEVIHEWMNSF